MLFSSFFSALESLGAYKDLDSKCIDWFFQKVAYLTKIHDGTEHDYKKSYCNSPRLINENEGPICKYKYFVLKSSLYDAAIQSSISQVQMARLHPHYMPAITVIFKRADFVWKFIDV